MLSMSQATTYFLFLFQVIQGQGSKDGLNVDLKPARERKNTYTNKTTPQKIIENIQTDSAASTHNNIDLGRVQSDVSQTTAA